MSLHQLAAEMNVWADENRIPTAARIRIWADKIAHYAGPPVGADAADIIAAIDGAPTPEEALAAYRSARAAVLGLPLADRVLVLENLAMRQDRANGEWVK